MTDRELLELAAMAAGHTMADPVDAHLPSGGMWIVGRGGHDQHWNPIHNDGDALRLAVALGMELDLHAKTPYSTITAHVHDGRDWRWASEIRRDDQYVATRRAIVRAAAELGRDMQ